MSHVVWQLIANIATLHLDSASVVSVWLNIYQKMYRALVSVQKLVRENKSFDIYFYDQLSPNYRFFD